MDGVKEIRCILEECKRAHKRREAASPLEKASFPSWFVKDLWRKNFKKLTLALFDKNKKDDDPIWDKVESMFLDMKKYDWCSVYLANQMSLNMATNLSMGMVYGAIKKDNKMTLEKRFDVIKKFSILCDDVLGFDCWPTIFCDSICYSDGSVESRKTQFTSLASAWSSQVVKLSNGLLIERVVDEILTGVKSQDKAYSPWTHIDEIDKACLSLSFGGVDDNAMKVFLNKLKSNEIFLRGQEKKASIQDELVMTGAAIMNNVDFEELVKKSPKFMTINFILALLSKNEWRKIGSADSVFAVSINRENKDANLWYTSIVNASIANFDSFKIWYKELVDQTNLKESVRDGYFLDVLNKICSEVEQSTLKESIKIKGVARSNSL